ncbi:MAG: metal ABC transporter permease [Euryarchaeota archaeon]|nr:metal ABC transporter permease [Euryarchaeota archaeon]
MGRLNAFDLFVEHEFLQRALLTGIIMGVVLAMLGIFVVLRGLAMIGDGIAHISFSGIALGLVLGFYPIGTALVFAVIGGLLIHFLSARRIVTSDTAVGIIFTAGFSFGVILVSRTGGFNVDIMGVLFGNIYGIAEPEMRLIVIFGGLLFLTLLVLHKEFLYVTFNDESARVSGLPVGFLNALFISLTAAGIVLAAQLVGVLLVTALLVVPAATSLQFAQSYRSALFLSVAFGVTSVIVGLLASAQYGFASGGSIAFATTVFFGVAVVLKKLYSVVRHA